MTDADHRYDQALADVHGGVSTVSAYPAENIARDVAGHMIAAHLALMPALTDPSARASTLLARRCAEVRRPDLENSLHGLGDTRPGRHLVDELKAALPALLDELRRHALHGPTPTQDAYDAACVALARHRERADKAEAAVQRVRDLCDTARDMPGGGFLNHLTAGEVLAALDGDGQ